jgi:hypothetical protein
MIYFLMMRCHYAAEPISHYAFAATTPLLMPLRHYAAAITLHAAAAADIFADTPPPLFSPPYFDYDFRLPLFFAAMPISFRCHYAILLRRHTLISFHWILPLKNTPLAGLRDAG